VSPTKGLVLRPLDFRSGALWDGLNVVERDGELVTRRGFTHLGNVPLGNIDNVDMEPFGTAVDLGGEWTTVGYLAVESGGTPASYSAGEVLGFVLSVDPPSASGVLVSDITFEYYSPTSATWKTLEVDTTLWKTDFPFVDWEGVTRFVVPHDWTEADPVSAPPGYDEGYAWIRFSASSFASIVVDSAVGYTDNPTSGDSSSLGDIRSFATRDGWRTLAPHLYGSGGAVSLVVINKDLTPKFNGLESSIGAYDAAGLGSGSLVYNPAGNGFMLATASKHIQWYRDNTSSTGWSNRDFPFDSTSTDNAYEDILRRSSLPPSVALALYSGRVFALDAEGNVRWSAPDEFWEVWPEENLYRLNSDGATIGVGMVAMQGALYIFTEGEIWRAVTGEPIPGQESLVQFEQVETVGCVARKTLVASESEIHFLANDGVRVFNGQESRTITDAVSDLFAADSESEWAIRNLHPCAGVVHERNREYRLYYASAGGTENDTCLVIQLDTRACWIWGAPQQTGLDTSGLSGQRRWGVRVSAATYRPDMGRILAVGPVKCVDLLDDGYLDGGSKIEWYAEMQNIGLGDPGRRRVTRVSTEAARISSSKMSVGVVVDGRRRDVRDVSQQVDASVGSSALGSGNAAGQALVEDYGSYGPYEWRGSSVGRSFRPRVAADATNYEAARIVGVVVDVAEG
jgi:hypothetical protein